MSLMPARGCVYRVGGGTSGFSIDGLTQAGGSMVIHSVTFTDRDLAVPVTTLAGTKLLYVFGEAVGDAQITATALLGPGTSRVDAVERVIQFMRSHRVSSGADAINVAFPGGSFKMWVAGLGLGTADPEYNTQTFAITGLIAQPP